MALTTTIIVSAGVLVFLLSIFYLLRQASLNKNDFDYPLPVLEFEKEKRSWWQFNPFLVSHRLKGMKRRRHEKIRRAHVEEEFNKFTHKKFSTSEVDKLGHVIDSHEKKKGRKIRKEFNLAKILNRKVKIRKSKRKRPLNEIEHIAIVESLRTLAKKKKSKYKINNKK